APPVVASAGGLPFPVKGPPGKQPPIGASLPPERTPDRPNGDDLLLRAMRETPTMKAPPAAVLSAAATASASDVLAHGLDLAEFLAPRAEPQAHSWRPQILGRGEKAQASAGQTAPETLDDAPDGLAARSPVLAASSTGLNPSAPEWFPPGAGPSSA
ncbi:unnamed protein product, partial [Polarella glacialis]